MTTELAERVRLAEASDTVKRIHVDQKRIKQGLPAVTVQTSAGPIKAGEVTMHGTTRMIHQYDKPLSCGAKVWIETYGPVTGEFMLP
jgi:hypothetical protein